MQTLFWVVNLIQKKEYLQYLQYRAISMIDKPRIKDDWSNSFLHVAQLVMFDRAIMTNKIVNGLSPENQLSTL